MVASSGNPVGAQFVLNCAPEPLTGFMLERRLAEARDHFLTASAGQLTLRALETFDPMVLENMLRRLGNIPEPASAQRRRDDLATEKCKLARRLDDAIAAGNDRLVAMATEFYNDAHDRLVTVANERRRGTKKESARRRRLVLRRLVEGLANWTLTDIARLVLESSRSWQHPPCPDLVDEYTLAEDENRNAAWLADVFRQDLKR